MEYIDNFIETVTSVGSTVGSVLFTILNVNFWLLNSIIYAVGTTATFIIKTISLLFEGLILAADEFQLFVSEISGGAEAAFNLIHKVGKVFVSVITTLLTSIYNFLSNITTESGSLIRSIFYFILYIVNGLKHFIVLTGSSVILLLESVPWSITTISRGTVDVTSYLWKTFVDGCNNITRKSIKTSKDTVKGITDQVYNIPRDAYLGLLLIIVVFLIHRYMKNTLIRFLRKSLKFLKTVLRVTVRSYRKIFRFLLRCLNNVNSFCLLLLRYLPQMNSDVQNVNNDEDELEDEQEFEDDDSDSGLDEPSPGDVLKLKRELENQKGARTCIVCLENPKNMIFLPCRHMCACQECCNTLVYRRAPCPVCRKIIRNTIQVYT